MDTINITPERFQQALAWMNGQPSTLGEQEVLQMLRSLTGRFQENCRALRPGPVARFRNLTLAPHPLSLTALLAETEKRKEAGKPGTQENPFLRELLADEGEDASATPSAPSAPLTPEQEVMEKVASESRLDSVLLINAIAFVGACSGFPPTRSKAQLILYCLYGERLGAGLERLPIEHPQLWKYGPVFPRAYKRGSVEDREACEASFLELQEREPALLTDLSAKTRSMMATPMADLCAVHKSARSPWGRTKTLFSEKWGVQIPDEEIAAFFRKGGLAV